MTDNELAVLLTIHNLRGRTHVSPTDISCETGIVEHRVYDALYGLNRDGLVRQRRDGGWQTTQAGRRKLKEARHD